MKFEYHNRAMRITPETSREHQVLLEAFRTHYSSYSSGDPKPFLYLTTYSSDIVRDVMDKLARLPPVWVETDAFDAMLDVKAAIAGIDPPPSA